MDAAPRPARRAGRDRRPRHVRGGGPAPARHAVRGQPADPGARVRGRPGGGAAHHALPAHRRRAASLLRLARQTRLLYDEVRDALAHGPGDRVDLPVARERRLAGHLVPRRARPRSPAGPTSRCACTWRTRPSPPTCCAAVTCSPPSPPTRSRCRAARSSRSARCATCPPRPRRCSSAGATAAGRTGRAMPVVVFNEKDALQHDVLRAHGVDGPPVVHRVPTSADFLEAVRLGLGWGAVPEPQLRPALADGSLVAARRPRPRRRPAVLAALADRLARPGPARRRRAAAAPARTCAAERPAADCPADAAASRGRCGSALVAALLDDASCRDRGAWW